MFIRGGFLTEVHWKALLQRMRCVLAEGRALAVLGWRDSNHDTHTRRLSREGRVVFHHQAPSKLGSNVGLVISNQFIGHPDFERIKARREMHPVVISNGQIKRLLKACDDLLHPPATIPAVVVTATLGDTGALPAPVTPIVVQLTEDSLTVPLSQDSKEMSQMEQPIEKFVQLFKAEAEKSPDGLVGKNVLGDIRRAAGVMGSNSAMVKDGWLEAHVSEGATNAGKYKATEKLLSYANGAGPALSSDPLMRARHLVAEKALVEEQITIKKVELLELEEKLKKIEGAEAILGQLEALMK